MYASLRSQGLDDMLGVMGTSIFRENEVPFTVPSIVSIVLGSCFYCPKGAHVPYCSFWGTKSLDNEHFLGSAS